MNFSEDERDQLVKTFSKLKQKMPTIKKEPRSVHEQHIDCFLNLVNKNSPGYDFTKLLLICDEEILCNAIWELKTFPDKQFNELKLKEIEMELYQ